MPTDAAGPAAVVAAAVAVAVWYRVAGTARTGFAIGGLLSSALIAMSVIAFLFMSSWPPAGAAGDAGILLAGCAAFASSAWLHFAFGIAGEADVR